MPENATDLHDRFAAHVFKHEQERIGQRWRIRWRHFVSLFLINGISRNLRSEVTKTSRYYFYDNGIRNTLIKNFNLLNVRNDVGGLWENYLIMERIKKQEYQQLWSNNYFWRTYDQKEIDWIEEREGQLHAYEFKSKAQSVKIPGLWKRTYPEASFEVIHSENYLDFIL